MEGGVYSGILKRILNYNLMISSFSPWHTKIAILISLSSPKNIPYIVISLGFTITTNIVYQCQNRGTLHPCRVNQSDCRASLYLFIGPDPWRLQFIIVTVKLNPRQGGIRISKDGRSHHYVHGKYLDIRKYIQLFYKPWTRFCRP